MKELPEQIEKEGPQNRNGGSNITEMIGRAMDESFGRIIPLITEGRTKELLSDYVPKSEVRGKLLSSSTLWKHEKNGSLKTYAIGGKRFYKRSEIENLIQEVK